MTTPALAERVPPRLAASCAAMTIAAVPDCPSACRLAEPERFDRVLSAFAAPFAEPDRGALVSLWSMYYLAALIVPATAALLCRDHVLPVGFDEVGIHVDPAGLAAFRLVHDGSSQAGRWGHRFDTLVDGHLAPFVALCAARTGLSPRIFWSNAAVILDWTLGQLRGDDDLCRPASEEAQALLGGRAPCRRLASPLRRKADGRRVRAVCCLRYRLEGVDDCGALCPRARAGLEAPASDREARSAAVAESSI